MKKNVRRKICFLAVAACATAVAGFVIGNNVFSANAAGIGVTMQDGATIRIPDTEENKGDIRFTASVDKTELGSKTYGIIVAMVENAESVVDEEFKFEANGSALVGDMQWKKVESTQENFSYNDVENTFSLVVSDVDLANYTQNFVARAYTFDGTTYEYSSFITRSIAEVAQTAIKDEDAAINNPEDTLTYAYRPAVLNMMGDKLVTGTAAVAGDLKLVDDTTTIDIGAVEEGGTYSFAYCAGNYDLRIDRETAIDYEYELTVADANVEKNLAKLPFYMYTAPDNGGSKYDVSEKLGWYSNTGAAKTAYLAVKEDGNLKIDGSTAVDGSFSEPRLQVTLSDPQFWDNYFYQVIYDHTFTNIPGSSGSYTLAVGTQNQYMSWAVDNNDYQSMPYLAAEKNRTVMDGKVRAVFAFDGDPIGFGKGQYTVPSNILNLLWLKHTNASATGLQAEISPFTFQRLTARGDFTTSEGNTISFSNYFGLSGSIFNTWTDSTNWNNDTIIWNSAIGHIACGQTGNMLDPTAMGVNAFQFLKWESSDENYIKVTTSEHSSRLHTPEECKTKLCYGHYKVVRGSTATDKKVVLTGILQIDDGIEYPVVRRIFNKDATTDTTAATATEFKDSHWQSSTHVTNGTVDFAVKAAGTMPRILQLTDTQVIDGSQAENTGNSAVVPSHYEKQTLSRVDQLSFDAVGYAIRESNPDLILVTGDMIYGQFDHTGAAWTKFVDYMESFNIPWAPIFGNHEIESNKGVAWQCAQLENAKHCLFKKRDITGSGNYTVGIVDSSDRLLRVFYMMDTNGNYNASAQSKEDGHVLNTNGFAEDQFEWFTTDVAKVKADAPNAKLSLSIHIPIMKFNDALTQYGYANESEQNAFQVDIDSHASKQDSDFGYIHNTYHSYYWDDDDRLWGLLVENGFDSVFSGHIHENSASVVYEGIRLQFGLKSGLYDSTLWKKTDGTLVKSNTDQGDPIIGGTQFVLGSDGSISTAAHLYYHGLDGVSVAK